MILPPPPHQQIIGMLYRVCVGMYVFVHSVKKESDKKKIIGMLYRV